MRLDCPAKRCGAMRCDVIRGEGFSPVCVRGIVRCCEVLRGIVRHRENSENSENSENIVGIQVWSVLID